MHGVDPDSVLCVLDRRGLRYDPHGALRRVVTHVVAALSHDAADGRYVDDGAAGLLHLRNHALHAEEHALGIDVHEPLPSLGAHSVIVVRAADACVVHEDVQTAVAGNRRLDGLSPVGLARDVELHEHRIAARLGYLRLQLAALVFDDVGDDDLRALACEYPALLSAHAVRAARDDRNLAFKSHSSPQSLCCRRF